MGAVNFSIDPKLLNFLTNHLSFDLFIETGTFEGNTLETTKTHFPKCISIELSHEYYLKARTRFENDEKITILHGNSGKVLEELLAKSNESSILFWLDAHKCEFESESKNILQTPVLDELYAISHLETKSVILIDDARFYLCPPPEPYDYMQWPDLSEIYFHLRKLSDKHALAVYNDIIVYYPMALKKKFGAFAQKHSIDLLDIMSMNKGNVSYIKELKEKEATIQNQHQQLVEKEAMIKSQNQQLLEKEAVIQMLDNLSFFSYMKRRIQKSKLFN